MGISSLSGSAILCVLLHTLVLMKAPVRHFTQVTVVTFGQEVVIIAVFVCRDQEMSIIFYYLEKYHGIL
jgi:hypothetical protein